MSSAESASESLSRSLGDLSTAGGPGRGPGDPEPLAGVNLGHYRLLRPLGAGGFGTVWAAEDERLGREVALKFLVRRIATAGASRTLLEAEARTVAALAHPGIVTLHALEEAEGRLFLVMEKVQGRMLSQILAEGPLPPDVVMDLGIQLAVAMAAAHDHGIIHRDLNPRNIMVTDEGRVKVLDFGLALRQAARPPEGFPPQGPSSPTGSSGGLRGTVPYMAPEQVEGCLLDARSDLFSLGVVLFEMACGVRPFHGSTLQELVEAILHGEPAWPVHLPQALRAVIARCLDKAPARRFRHGRELAAALDRARHPRLLTEGPSVAVLPFRDLSVGQDETPFCEGMAEEILAALARVPDLQVASRTSSFPFKGAALEPVQLCERLGVRALVAGSVRKEGERLRIGAEVLDGASGFQLWRGTFDRDRRDVFHLQEEIAGEVAAALRLTLTPAPRPRLALDPDAYEDYLRGRHFYYRYQRQGMRFAQQMFQQALEREPGFAAAWAGVANCAAWLFIYADRSEANRAQAEEASARALALDPDLAEAHASRGVALSALGDGEGAEAAFRRALELDPTLYEAAYFHARHCFAQGQMAEALAAFERAIALRPEDCQAVLLVAQVHAGLGHPEAALEARRRGLQLAEARLRQAPDDLRTRYLGANALVALGEREKGLTWARMVRGLDPDDPMLLYNLGCIHALAGSPEEALDCLEAAVQAGLSQKGWFLHDGDLEPLRSVPRFQALVQGLD